MFTKRDLKGGDVVLHHNGVVSIFIENLGILVHPEGSFGIWDYKNDLTHVLCNDFNIVAVRRPKVSRSCSFGAFKNRLGDRVFPEKPEPKVGDRVIVTDETMVFSTYDAWYKQNAPALRELNSPFCHKGDVGVVITKAPNTVLTGSLAEHRMLCACIKAGEEHVFLIDVRGIEVICDEQYT